MQFDLKVTPVGFTSLEQRLAKKHSMINYSLRKYQKLANQIYKKYC